MYFCGQSIKRRHVIGLGMLFTEFHPDEKFFISLCRTRYRFTLYLKFYSIEVYSDWFDLKGAPEDVRSAEKLMEKFKKEYWMAYEDLKLDKPFWIF